MPDGAPVDVLAEMGRLAAEMICRTLFGRALGGEAAATVVQAFARYQARIGHLDMLSVLGLPDWLPRPRFGVGADVARIHAVVDGLVRAGAWRAARPS